MEGNFMSVLILARDVLAQNYADIGFLLRVVFLDQV
jgi:hypothetical protein